MVFFNVLDIKFNEFVTRLSEKGLGKRQWLVRKRGRGWQKKTHFLYNTSMYQLFYFDIDGKVK
jgi:hypothetical protein